MSNPNIAEVGAPYRWPKGKSGNPSGRPRKVLPFTDGYRDILAAPLPDEVRKEMLEKKVYGESLPKDMTFADALVLAATLQALGIKTGADINFSREIREVVEGRVTERIEISQPEQVGGEEIKDKIRHALVDRIVKRAQIFNMPVPALSEMAAEAGVEVDIPKEAETEKSGGGE